MILRKKDKNARTVSKVRGGVGEIKFEDVLSADLLPNKLGLCSFVTLKKGDSVGRHAHSGESEIFYCVSGKGFVFDQGKEVEIYLGDTVYTLDNETHSLRNEMDEDFVVLALIIKN